MRRSVSDDVILAVYRDTIDALYAFVSRRCGGDRDVAEDVTQETWLRAVRDWRARGMPDRPIAWLTTVAGNLLRNRYRERRPLPLDEVSQDRLLGFVHGEAEIDSAAVATIVNQALARLPRRQSRLLELFHFDRRRVADIAASLGLTERAVEGRLRRARQNLRRQVELVLQREGERS
jgi:RNA polymerase sigma-70 factor, ECF subfamily